MENKICSSCVIKITSINFSYDSDRVFDYYLKYNIIKELELVIYLYLNCILKAVLFNYLFNLEKRKNFQDLIKKYDRN